MDEPRDLAVQWLAEVLDRAGCADSAGFVFAPVSVLAAAIFDQPGVEVDFEYLIAKFGWAMSAEREHATHRQVVIRLAAEPLDGDQ